MKMLAVKSFFSTSHLYFFPADLTRSVYFHVLFYCHYFPYLVLVFVFKIKAGIHLKAVFANISVTFPATPNLSAYSINHCLVVDTKQSPYQPGALI